MVTASQCDTCIHQHVCKDRSTYEDHIKAVEELSRYWDGPTAGVMPTRPKVKIAIACENYLVSEPITPKVFSDLNLR